MVGGEGTALPHRPLRSGGRVTRRLQLQLGIQLGEYLAVAEVDVERGVVSLMRGAEPIAWEPRRAAKIEVYQEENRSVTTGDR